MLVAYMRDLEAGTLKVNQTPAIVSDTGTISVWDARAGYGQVIARQAVEWAIEAARKWKFAATDAQQPHEWLLHFEFSRGGATGHATAPKS